jgi:hypothetical protein
MRLWRKVFPNQQPRRPAGHSTCPLFDRDLPMPLGRQTTTQGNDMRRTGSTLAILAAAAMFAGSAQETEAQQAHGWWDWALPALIEARGGHEAIPDRRRDSRDRRDDGARAGRSLPDVILGRDDRRRGNARGGQGNARGGPPFCQNGQGHPVHGRQWCRDKGFGLGGGVFGTSRWDTRSWDDVILRAPRGTDRRSGVMDRGGLIDVLGDVVFGRLTAEGSRLGATGPLTGRWLQTNSAAAVLQIRSGGIPVAELTDLDGNGRVDAVLISRK